MEHELRTDRLALVPRSKADLIAELDSWSAEQRDQLSADWLRQLDESSDRDPWVHGFVATLREDGSTIGHCGFKGPPSESRMVEISYAVEPDRQSQGFATEMAGALVRFAFEQDDVAVVRAHTLPEANASTRVLTKCGFRHVGEVVDPEDGPVWRWERVGSA